MSDILAALGEHLAAGRLDLTEFESRSATVARARTGSDLAGLFRDLPGPHPVGTLARTAVDRRARAYQILGAVSGLTAMVVLVLFLILTPHWDSAWMLVLLIPIVTLVTRLVQGGDVSGR